MSRTTFIAAALVLTGAARAEARAGAGVEVNAEDRKLAPDPDGFPASC